MLPCTVVSFPSPKQQCTQHCFHREVHIPHGTPYEPDENTVIADMQLSQTNVSGYYTDMMVIHPTFIPGKWFKKYLQFLSGRSRVHTCLTHPRSCVPTRSLYSESDLWCMCSRLHRCVAARSPSMLSPELVCTHFCDYIVLVHIT